MDKSRMLKKHQGGMYIGNMIVIITLILVAIMLIMSYASWHSQLSAKDTVDLIADSYIRSMESSGYLTDVQQEQLLNELDASGVTDIDLTGTTTTSSGYGQKIVLHITGTLHFNGSHLVIDENGIRFREGATKTIEITRSGTAYR